MERRRRSNLARPYLAKLRGQIFDMFMACVGHVIGMTCFIHVPDMFRACVGHIPGIRSHSMWYVSTFQFPFVNLLWATHSNLVLSINM